MSAILSSDSVLNVSSDATSESGNSLEPLSGRVPPARILFALNQIAVMSQNGIDLAEAIETTASHTRHLVLADQLERIHDSINGGLSLSAAVNTHGKCFPATFAPMLAAAESTGTVPTALGRMAEMMRSDLKLRSSVAGAMIYPIILVSASMLVMVALIFGILPRFAEVFEQLGRPSPAITQILLGIGSACREHIWFCIGGTVALVVGSYIATKIPAVLRFRDYGLLNLPLLKDAYRPLVTGRLFRLLGSMISGGVPLLDAIRLAQHSTGNLFVRGLLKTTEEDLIAGHSASRAMMEVDFLPSEASQMIATAERTGRLAEVLADVGVFYEEEGAQQLKKLVSLLEPSIILAMGVLVSGIVLSVMLPLLDVSTAQ